MWIIQSTRVHSAAHFSSFFNILPSFANLERKSEKVKRPMIISNYVSWLLFRLNNGLIPFGFKKSIFPIMMGLWLYCMILEHWYKRCTNKKPRGEHNRFYCAHQLFEDTRKIEALKATNHQFYWQIKEFFKQDCIFLMSLYQNINHLHHSWSKVHHVWSQSVWKNYIVL